VNSKFDGFENRTGPIPPVFTKFQKIRPVFLTLLPPAAPHRLIPIFHLQQKSFIKKATEVRSPPAQGKTMETPPPRA
jgi:hypothetical protein